MKESKSNDCSKAIPHLEGLRGIAIIMVLLFHCFRFFRNGFLGVDIFFVLSGYLLFRHFWGEYESFQFGNFITKKIRRLLPMGAVISILSCGAALYFFPAELFVQTGKTALSCLLGCSNLYLDYIFADYFSSDIRLNPLVHTWYLSVIAQVYILFACLSLLCRRRKLGTKVLIVSCVSLFSLIIYYAPLWVPCISVLIKMPSSYYWTSGRLWMIGLGALAHFLPSRKEGRFIGGLAFALLLVWGLSPIALSAVGTAAAEVTTVLCTCLCIAYGKDAFGSRLLCSHALLQFGRFSFSLYIIHWPLIVFSSYFAELYPQLSVRWVHLLQVIVSVLSAVFLYHLVEKRRFDAVRSSALFLAAAGLAVLPVATKGLRDYIYPEVNAIRATVYADTGKCTPLTQGPLYDSLPPFCQETHRAGLGDMQYWGEKIPLLYSIGSQSEPPDFLLIGDSHAEALYPGMDIVAQEQGWHGAYLHTYVIPLENYYSEYRSYQRWDREKAEMLLRYINQNPGIKTVFIANFWDWRFRSSYLNWDGERIQVSEDEEKNYACLYEFLKRLKTTGKRIVVFADVPIMSIKPIREYMQKQKRFCRPVDEAKVSCTRAMYERCYGTLNTYLKEWEEAGLCTVLHPEKVLLQSGKCHVIQNGVMYYKDGNHLSLPGSIRCVKSLEQELKEILTCEDSRQ